MRTLLDAFQRNVAHTPQALAYQFFGEGDTEDSLTYSALAELASRYARALLHLAPHSRGEPLKVVLALPQGKAFVAAYFGCLLAQAIAVPTFPPRNASQAERLKLVLMDLGECVVLASRKSLDVELADLRHDSELTHAQWVSAEESGVERSCSRLDFHAEPDAIAMLQYTSGSTAQPRGVMVSHANLVANAELIRQSFGHDRPNRRMVLWVPPHHDMGLGGIVQSMYSAFPTLLLPADVFVRRPLRWLAAISDFRATTSGGPNFAYQMCVDTVGDRELVQLDLGCWDIAFCGAEPINPETLVAFGKRFAAAGLRASAFHPCYGLAEATLMVSSKPAQESVRTLTLDARALSKNRVRVEHRDARSDGTLTLVSCGVVQSSLDVRVVDPALGTELGTREIGEIWVSGPSVTQGYWGNADKTAETFGQRLPGKPHEYLRTGDLGFMDQGELYVTGRLKDMLIVRGANYYPQDLERECLLACPDVAHLRAAAFAVPGRAHESVVLVLEVPRTQIGHEHLVQRINARLTEKFGIRANTVVFVPRRTIKTTTSGKMQRLALRAEYLAATLITYHVWQESTEDASTAGEPRPFDPSTVDGIVHWMVERIAAITHQVPNVIDRDDSFAALALDSVAALEILTELDSLGVDLPSDVLYQCNTPALLAQEIFRVCTGRRAPVPERT